MRIERYDPPEPLTPRVVEFLRSELSGVCADDIVSHQTQRIDYICLGGLFAVELKSLEGAPQERIDNLTDKLRERKDFPDLMVPHCNFGALALQMEKPERVISDLRNRIGRSIRNHLKHANSQFKSHQSTFPRKNMVRTVLLVNEDHTEYTPDFVREYLCKELSSNKEGEIDYSHIDMVFYLTERHQAFSKGNFFLPMLAVSGPACRDDVWKKSVLTYVMRKWVAFNGYGEITAGRSLEMVPITNVPPVMKRHEKWKLDYDRDPYFRNLTNRQLRDVFDEIMLLARIRLFKMMPEDSPQFPSRDVFAYVTHIQSEIGWRGSPREIQKNTLERDLAAARRLKMPEKVLRRIKQDHFARSVKPRANPV